MQDDYRNNKSGNSIIQPPIIYESWKLQLKQASRSIQIRLSNVTDRTLVLKSSALTSGIWRLDPPNEIPPSNEVDFGSEANGIYSSTGKITFTLKDEEQINMPITFSWNVGLFGTPEYNSNVFSIEPVVIGNHMEVILHFSSDELFIATTPIQNNNHNEDNTNIKQKTEYDFTNDKKK